LPDQLIEWTNFLTLNFWRRPFEFLLTLNKKHSEKILFNIRKAQVNQYPELFSKLKDDIW